MIRTALGAFAALAAAAVVGAILIVAQPGVLEAQSHSATRSFQQDWAAPSSELRVTITVSNLGGFGQAVETLPAGFTYLRATPADLNVEVDGQDLAITVFGTSSFTYYVTVPAADGQYTFSGIIRNADLAERTIAGDTQLRVGPPPTPAPTSTPEPTPDA